MFICQYDANAPGNPVTDITTLFNQYAAQNIHTTVAAAWGARFQIPFSRLSSAPQNYTMLADSSSKHCNANEFVISSPLMGCPMVMSYDAVWQNAYVCHASGGLSGDMPDVLKGRACSLVLLTTPVLSSGGNMVDDVYTGIINDLLGMGYGTENICLIDGMALGSMVWMSGSGDFAAA